MFSTSRPFGARHLSALGRASRPTTDARTPRARLCTLLSEGFRCSDFAFISTWTFIWKVVAITAVSCIPLVVIKILRGRFSPPSYSKLS